MRRKEADRLCRKHLLAQLPGFAASRGLLYRAPIRDLLNGFCFDPSAFDRQSFYLYVFVQPLYVPCSHIILSFGTRLGFGWELTKENENEVAAKLLTCIRNEGLPWLEPLQTPADFANNIATSTTMYKPDGLHLLRAIAYSQALVGDFQKALGTLKHLFATYDSPGPADPEWQHNLFKEVNCFRDTLLQDHAAAQALLKRWRVETLEAIRLKPD
jgi:hypothetical protein